MPVKEWFRKLQPLPLYVVLTMTILFFITEMIVSHLTHSLTLLMDSYHMLCNIFALSGCIITIKYGTEFNNPEADIKQSESNNSIEETALTSKPHCQDKKGKKSSTKGIKQEKKLKNTFGWTRIDVISMLICCVFLSSFSFSIYVEALQTLTHIDHQDAMHHPRSVLSLGAAGLVLNGLCYLLIGGFTFHQGSFLYITESGDVVLNKVVIDDSLQKGARRLSRTKQIFSSPPKKRQGLWEMARDIVGCCLVITCSIGVIFTEPEVAKFVDPVISLISATVIMFLSYPYIKESCLILLQTIPDTIDIEIMKKELVNHFPDIKNIHDFHIWQLKASQIISTVHIIFENPKVYKNIMDEIKEFFLKNGVTQVTIQPEFFRQSTSMDSLNSTKLPEICLVACQGELCKLSHCCPSYQDLSKFKSSSKEIIPTPENSTPTLKSVRIIDDELPSLRGSVSSYSLNSIDSEYSKTSSEAMKHGGQIVIHEEEENLEEAPLHRKPVRDMSLSKSDIEDCDKNMEEKPLNIRAKRKIPVNINKMPLEENDSMDLENKDKEYSDNLQLSKAEIKNEDSLQEKVQVEGQSQDTRTKSSS